MFDRSTGNFFLCNFSFSVFDYCAYLGHAPFDFCDVFFNYMIVIQPEKESVRVYIEDRNGRNEKREDTHSQSPAGETSILRAAALDRVL